MNKGTLVVLAINNAVIAAGLLVLHFRLTVVEGAVDRLGPVLLRQLASVLDQANENSWMIGRIVDFLSQ